jgi:hypothetical protein
MAYQFSTTLRNAMMDAITTAIGNGGLIRIYTGTRPANPAADIGAATLLGTLTGASPFAPSASGGVLTASAITSDSSADATGTATWFRVWQSNGTTAVIDGDVATSGSDMNINTTSIVSGGPIEITSFTLTAPGA